MAGLPDILQSMQDALQLAPMTGTLTKEDIETATKVTIYSGYHEMTKEQSRLCARYLDSLTARVRDTELTIWLRQEAIRKMSDDHPERSSQISSLQALINDTRHIEDLKGAIGTMKHACSAPKDIWNGSARPYSDDEASSDDGHKYDVDNADAALFTQETASVDKESRYRSWYGNDPYGNWKADNHELRNNDPEELGSIEKTVRAARHFIHTAPENHPGRTWYLDDLETRFSNPKVLTHLEEAIRAARKAVAKMRLHEAQDKALVRKLDRDICLAQEAAGTTPIGHPSRSAKLSVLGDLLQARHLRTHSIADLEEAIQVFQNVVEMVPDDIMNSAISLYNLEARRSERFRNTNTYRDLKRAILVTKDAIDATPDAHPAKQRMMENLSLMLHSDRIVTSPEKEFDNLIQMMRKSKFKAPKQYLPRSHWLHKLGNLLRRLYAMTCAPSDLEKAINIMQKAVDTVMEEDPNRPVYLSDLGTMFTDRYLTSRAEVDLETAIAMSKNAIDLYDDDSDNPIPATICENFSIQLRLEFLRTGATEVFQSSVVSLLDSDPDFNSDLEDQDQACRLYNLGELLSFRFLRTGTLVDLDEAIRFTRAAVKSTPDCHLCRGTRLHKLGCQLGDRFLKTAAMADLEEAIRTTMLAVESRPGDHSNSSRWLKTLGYQYFDRYLLTEKEEDLVLAYSCFQTTLHVSNASVVDRIEAAQGTFQCCIAMSDWEQAYQCSKIAVQLIQRLCSPSLPDSDKLFMIGRFSGLGCNMAAVALSANKEPFSVLQQLEESRGVLFSGRYSTSPDSLVEHSRAGKQAASSKNRRDREESSIESPYAPRKKRITSLLSKADALDAAGCGPIAIINVSRYRCDALLIEKHRVRSLALPDLSVEELECRRQENRLGDVDTLEWLWDVVASPVLDALGFDNPPPDGDFSRMWWIPTGALSRFPLHAAGYHDDETNETVLDRVMSSYSSSVKALIHGRRHAVTSKTSLDYALLVAMEQTPGLSRLPFATKEIETIGELCRSMRLHHVQPKRELGRLQSHLDRCKIFHFAGHGQLNQIDPTQSTLLLEDWKKNRLALAHIADSGHMVASSHSYSRRDDAQRFLAYLSTCGTGEVGDERAFDESTHLVSACQTAGFRHAIGTLWQVDDEICVEVARITYEGIRDGRLTDRSVCQGLHNAMRELRTRWVSSDERTARKGKSVRIPGRRRTTDLGTRLDHKKKKKSVRIRDVVVCDDGDENGLWVPYVHYGV